MKINLKSQKRQQEITSIRSQIKDAGDLRKFDNFLSKHDTFDFANSEQTKAAGACCGGDECCDIVISVTPPHQ